MKKFVCLGKSGTNKYVNLSCIGYRAIKKDEVIEVTESQAKIIEAYYSDSFIQYEEGDLQVGEQIEIEGEDYIVENRVDEDSYQVEKLSDKPKNKMAKNIKNKTVSVKE